MGLEKAPGQTRENLGMFLAVMVKLSTLESAPHLNNTFAPFLPAPRMLARRLSLDFGQEGPVVLMILPMVSWSTFVRDLPSRHWLAGWRHYGQRSLTGSAGRGTWLHIAV